ncbi:DUF3159 domain-containing protein [Pseudoclavibacter soli]|uniref:DUF3159 domain-containing protein n=1 Tax=Pseudoclavibacter soli TaxID=452623 RepID=UPI0003F54EB3|nr:DUF3159 domain-containing protein [Pseudoclavibacter soli]
MTPSDPRLTELANRDSLDASTVWKALGGVRGLFEAVLPGLLFVAVFTATTRLWWAVGASLAAVVVLAAWRLIDRGDLTQIANGLFGVLLSSGLALLTGRASANYLPGLIVNGTVAVVLGVSIAVGWPLIGVLIAVARGNAQLAHDHPLLRRAGAWATAVWMFVSLLRLGVQLPLYLQAQHDDQIATLGIVKLSMGLPLLAAGVVVSWLLLRPVTAILDQETESTDDKPAQSC